MGSSRSIAAAALTILSFCGCALTPRIVNMVPGPGNYLRTTTAKTIAVGSVTGGEESDPMFKGSRISDVNLRGALIMALQNAGYVAYGSPSIQTDYRLEARILVQTQPAAGFDMTSTLAVRYSLFRGGDAQPTWEQEVRSSYTASVGEAFSGAERLNKANEGVVRKNLEQFLKEFGTLTL